MITALILFYNLSGIIMCILAMCMFAIRKQEGEEGVRFNTAKHYFTVIFLLSGVSMFISQFDRGISQENFEILEPLKLFFFFLIAQGFLWSFFILYASAIRLKQLFVRILFPVFLLFGVYAIAYFFVGDEPVFSVIEFLSRLPHEPMLMLRCVILLTTTVSLLYCIRLCNIAKSEYNNLIRSYFSETDFSRSIWLANLLASAKGLSVWILLSYFYTTPVLEMVVGTLMIVVFTFYVKEFYEYKKRYECSLTVLLPTNGEKVFTVAEAKNEQRSKMYEEHQRYATLLVDWEMRADKPFTRQSLTVGDVAKDLGVPKYQVSNYVNRNKGNFCSWINNLRVSEASRLLHENPELSISDIAERTGFCDLPAFSRAFKKIHRISPREYRNRGIYERKS